MVAATLRCEPGALRVTVLPFTTMVVDPPPSRFIASTQPISCINLARSHILWAFDSCQNEMLIGSDTTCGAASDLGARPSRFEMLALQSDEEFTVFDQRRSAAHGMLYLIPVVRIGVPIEIDEIAALQVGELAIFQIGHHIPAIRNIDGTI